MKSKRNCGFSMAEIAIALFILALGLLAIIALFPAAVQFGRTTINRAKSNSLARSAEAILTYRGILTTLESNSSLWKNAGSLGSAYEYPYHYTQDFALPEARTWTDEGDPSYSWSAYIFNGGPGSYLSRLDRLYFVQIRVYRNYPERSSPIELFEVFMTR